MNNYNDWLHLLPSAIPFDQIPAALEDMLDEATLGRYQQAVWLNTSVWRALHIEAELKVALQNAGFEAGMCVLDLGCGNSVKAHFLLDSGAGQVIGIDDDPDEIALAHKLRNAGPYNADQLVIQPGDALEPLPFADNHFDMAFIGDPYIGFFDTSVLGELRRVVKPDGIIFMATTNILPSVHFSQDRAFASRVDAARWAALMDTAYGEHVQATGETYEAQFFAACQHLGLQHRTIPVQRGTPVSPVYEMLTVQTFAAFTAHSIRHYLDPADWLRLRNAHDPAAPEYLFKRAGAVFVDYLSVAVGRLTDLQR